MEISEKSEMMEFLRQDQIRSKIVVNNKCLQQINNFKYLGCDIFYQNEKNIQQK
jgi:ABC-type tungstate transport system permease subunit